jgi:hypothetical protein
MILVLFRVICVDCVIDNPMANREKGLEALTYLPAPVLAYVLIWAHYRDSRPFASCCETCVAIPSPSGSAGSFYEARSTHCAGPAPFRIHRNRSQKPPAPSSFRALQQSYLPRFHHRHATWCTLLCDGNVATKPAACSAELSGCRNPSKCGRRTIDADEMGEQRQEERRRGEAVLLPAPGEYFRARAEGEGGAVSHPVAAAADGARAVLGDSHRYMDSWSRIVRRCANV